MDVLVESKLADLHGSNARKFSWVYVTPEKRAEWDKAQKDRDAVKKLAHELAALGFAVDPEDHHGKAIALEAKDLERIVCVFKAQKRKV